MKVREILANPHDGVTLRVAEDSIRILTTGADTGGAYELFELQGPRDSGPPVHAHPWSESYVMVEGEAEITVGDKKMRATPGCFISIPAETLHTYKILSDSAKFIIITTPSGASEFFAELDRETKGSPGDLEKIIGVAVKHGFNIPPPANG